MNPLFIMFILAILFSVIMYSIGFSRGRKQVNLNLIEFSVIETMLRLEEFLSNNQGFQLISKSCKLVEIPEDEVTGEW